MRARVGDIEAADSQELSPNRYTGAEQRTEGEALDPARGWCQDDSYTPGTLATHNLALSLVKLCL